MFRYFFEKIQQRNLLIYRLDDYSQNFKVDSETGIMQKECEKKLKDFFKDLRQIKKNNNRNDTGAYMLY